MELGEGRDAPRRGRHLGVRVSEGICVLNLLLRDFEAGLGVRDGETRERAKAGPLF